MDFSTTLWIIIGLVWGINAVIDVISDKEIPKGRAVCSEIIICLAAFNIVFFCN